MYMYMYTLTELVTTALTFLPQARPSPPTSSPQGYHSIVFGQQKLQHDWFIRVLGKYFVLDMDSRSLSEFVSTALTFLPQASPTTFDPRLSSGLGRRVRIRG